MMTNNGHSIHQQPYEVIETEETITRYFNPTDVSKGSTFSTTNNHHSKSHRSEQNSCDEDGPKIELKNCQFQVLYEKFTKMRMVMSELKQKLKEINLAKNNFPFPMSDADSREVIDLTGCHKTKLRENLSDSRNGDDDDRDCTDRFSVTSQPPLPEQIFDDETHFRSMTRDTEFAHKIHPKQVVEMEATLLIKSKKLLTNLIDQELQRVQSSEQTLLPEKSILNVPMSYGNSEQLKTKCIERIAEELAVLKDLEGIYGS